MEIISSIKIEDMNKIRRATNCWP